MATAICQSNETVECASRDTTAGGSRLAALGKLAEADIETSLIVSLSDNLHHLFDPVCEDTLPIYFGPLLGRLYLEGL